VPSPPPPTGGGNGGNGDPHIDRGLPPIPKKVTEEGDDDASGGGASVSDEVAAQASLAFVGTVLTSAVGTPHEITVRVSSLQRAPAVLARLAGQTVRLTVAKDPPAVGSTWGFLADQVQLGTDVAANQLARVVPSHLTWLVADDGPAADVAAESRPDAVIVGRVVDVRPADLPGPVSEHDPDWHVATVVVDHVQDGAIAGNEVEVLFANSHDVAWASSPKLSANQEASLTLRPSGAALATTAAYVVTWPEDVVPLG